MGDNYMKFKNLRDFYLLLLYCFLLIFYVKKIKENMNSAKLKKLFCFNNFFILRYKILSIYTLVYIGCNTFFDFQDSE